MRSARPLSPTRIPRAGLEHLRALGEVLLPDESEEPILAPAVRASIFRWLAELRAVDELSAVGIRPRSTALLEGPPGCGKTTLAHHLGARLGIPILIVGSEHLMEMYMGESEKKIARLFDSLASAEQPCILFLDEIDAIGAKRTNTSGDSGGAGRGKNSALTVLLRKVEAFQGVMIAATNRADVLDAALWRRFGMQIKVDLPDPDSRWGILKRYLLPFIVPDSTLDLLTDLTDGASPALLRQVMEGVKRAIVLGPRLSQPSLSLHETLESVIGENAPHPDYAPPPLWSEKKTALAELAALDIAWPPQRADKPEDAP